MYDNPRTITYSLGSHNFGAGAGAFAIRPPAGCKTGRVVDIHVMPTVTFTQVTTPAFVRVGTTGVPAKYAELNLGAAAATDGYNLSNTGVKPQPFDMEADVISQLEVVFVAPTGGTPAGTGLVQVTVDWFKRQGPHS